jgi:hypothetical protein
MTSFVEGSDPIPEVDTTYDPRHVTDHVEQGPALLPPVFQDKPVFTAILQALLAQVQKIEDAAWEVITFRRIEHAEGKTLDMLGSIVRRGRGGLSDANYRIAIRAQIRILKSSGRPEDLIGIALLSTPTGTILRLVDEYPAGFRFDVGSPVTWPIDILFFGVRLAKPAGVRFGIVYSDLAPGTWFRFAPSTVSVTSATQGFGDALQPATGGKFRTMKVTA